MHPMRPARRAGIRRRVGAGYVVDGEALFAHVVDHCRVKAFKADGAEFEDGGRSIGSQECIGKGEDDEHAMRWAGGEIERGGENVDAGAL